jgi:hypothetical protein
MRNAQGEYYEPGVPNMCPALERPRGTAEQEMAYCRRTSSIPTADLRGGGREWSGLRTEQYPSALPSSTFLAIFESGLSCPR